MKKALGIFTAAMLCFTMLAGCAKTDTSADGENTTDDVVENSTSARVTVEGTKLMVDGKELWVNGANTPWQNWNDFNGNMDVDFWESNFAQLKEDKINCTRIWVNCNGMGTVQLKTTGEIKSINEAHWTDLDKLFEIAEKYQIYVMPTLLSFDHFKEPNSGCDRWRLLVTNKEYADSFAEQYAAEFAKRYKDCEYILGVDIMNEPDWVHENQECGQLSWDDLSYFFGKCAAAIHENSDMLVTVGLGIIKYNSDSFDGNKISDAYLQELTGDEKAYVDFYSTHYYIWERQWYGFPFDKTPVEFGLDDTKPALIGETSNDDEKDSGMSLADKYKSSYDNGWCGVMAWMDYHSDDSSGCDSVWYRYDLTQEAAHTMYELIPEKIYPLGE